MDPQEIIDELQEIQQAMNEQVERLIWLLNEVPGQAQGTLENYILPTLQCAISNDHPWMTRDPNLDTVIQEIEEMEAEDES